jgi:hypothetical protein
LTRKPSIFYTEKRVLTMFPYWLILAVLVVLLVLSFLPYRVSKGLIQSPISKKVIATAMQQRGLLR